VREPLLGCDRRVAYWVSVKAAHRQNLFRVAGAALGALTLAWTFRDVSGADLQRVFEGRAWTFALALVPFAFVHLADVIGLHALLLPFGLRPAFYRTFEVAMLSDTVTRILPLGSAFGETLRPILLVRRCDVPASHALGVSVARKFLIVGTEALIVFGLCIFGGQVLAELTPPGLAGTLRPALFVSGLVLAGTALAVGLAFARGNLLLRTWLLLRRLTPQRWRRPLRSGRRHLLSAQASAAVLATLPARSWLLPAAMYLGIWLIEALETFVLLSLVGAEVSWQQAFALEIVLGFVRSLAVVSPGGIGLQDAGYALLLSGLDPGSATTSGAFILLKRSKEFTWCAFAGLWCVVTKRVSARTPAVVVISAS
jgi:Lysylphosphatidylglycerol synthase TM region